MRRATKNRRWALCIGVVMRVVFSSHMIAEEDLHRVRATMIAHESSLHTSVDNRDIYRVRVTPRRGQAFDAVVVDNFPSYAESLPVYLQREGATFSVQLRRTPYCDRIGNGAGELTHCFAIEHGSWRAPRGMQMDAWWK